MTQVTFLLSFTPNIKSHSSSSETRKTLIALQVCQSARRVLSARPSKMCPKHFKNMDDFLLTLTASFVDTDTGEVLANAHFSKPLSIFTPDNYQKYFDSALRGIRQGRKIALYVLFSSDRNFSKVKEQTFSF